MIRVDIAVIGAGVFGSWTAWHALKAGASVVLIDSWGPGHTRSSSGGESRIIRMGYGADRIYTRMAMSSLAQWKELFQRTDQSLFHPTGVLWIARHDDPYSEATRDTLQCSGVRTEILTVAEMARRYPQMTLTDSRNFGILEPDSGALMARRAVNAVVQDFLLRGGKYVTGAIDPPAGEGVLDAVRTAGGEQISAGNFVFACGAWLPKLFPDILKTRIYPTRQEVLFFAPPAGDASFSPKQLPVWIDFTDPRGPYGFPDLEGRGFKLAFDRHGDAYDPDRGDRVVNEKSVAEARAFLGERFPVLRDAPLNEFRVCQYENTSSGDFLADGHPHLKNVWLAGGGSGHGFKHGPAVGEYVAARVLGGAAAEPRFSLGNKMETQHRTVY